VIHFATGRVYPAGAVFAIAKTALRRHKPAGGQLLEEDASGFKTTLQRDKPTGGVCRYAVFASLRWFILLSAAIILHGPQVPCYREVLQ
jgi:hypothetical protein